MTLSLFHPSQSIFGQMRLAFRNSQRLRDTRGLILVALSIILILLSAFGARAQDNARVARSWTCHATLHIVGTGATFTPTPWSMSGPIVGSGLDREKQCKEHILKNMVQNGSVWQMFKGQLPPAQQDAICKAGKAQIRVDYGFDERQKGWDMLVTATNPPCQCEKTCSNGYHLSGNGNCAKGLCSAGGLPDQAYFSNGEGLFIWKGQVYHQVSPTLGPCLFK